MQKINAVKAGLALGTFGAIVHVAWAALVYIGWAQPMLDFMFEVHMAMNPVIVLTFDLVTALELVAIVFVVWYIVGYLVAMCWNYFNR
ncbi:MAG: hypothetical protein AAB355_00925 [Patescibacteria group bacterium]